MQSEVEVAGSERPGALDGPGPRYGRCSRPVVLTEGWFCSPGGIGQWLETFLLVMTWEDVPLASSG